MFDTYFILILFFYFTRRVEVLLLQMVLFFLHFQINGCFLQIQSMWLICQKKYTIVWKRPNGLTLKYTYCELIVFVTIKTNHVMHSWNTFISPENAI